MLTEWGIQWYIFLVQQIIDIWCISIAFSAFEVEEEECTFAEKERKAWGLVQEMREGLEKCRNLPFVSVGLVLVNVIVYLMCMFTGSLLYSMGRLSVLDVMVNKEYGRIITSLFLHSDLSHIFNNMLILFFLGAMIEKEIGHIRYAVFYFLSGIGGNLLSLMSKYMTSDWSASIGASGAVFGLDGVLLAMVLLSNRKMSNVTPKRVILMIAYSLYSGFTGRNIDNAAHIGGLLTGFAAGTIMCIVERRRKKSGYRG